MAVGHDAWGLCTIFAGVGPHKIVSALADVSVIRLGCAWDVFCNFVLLLLPPEALLRPPGRSAFRTGAHLNAPFPGAHLGF